MTDTMFRMLERLQHADARLRRAERRLVADPFEIVGLHLHKSRLREGLSRLTSPLQPA